MIPRNSWICVLAVSAAMAQTGGYTLRVSNTAAPGSRASYWLSYDVLPDDWSRRPTLTLKQQNHPPIPLDTTETSHITSGEILLPENLDQGPAVLTLTSGDIRASADIEIVASAPLIDFSLTTPLTRPARAGDTITVRGSGLGNVTAAEVRASLSTQSLTVLEAGRDPDQRGTDRYVFAIPSGATLPDDCYTPLQLTVRGTTMPAGRFATSPNATGPCRHPWNLTTSQLQILDEVGTIPLAMFTMLANAGPSSDTIGGGWSSTRVGRYDSASAELSPMPAWEIAARAPVSPAPGGCRISHSRGQSGLGGSGGGASTLPQPPPSLGSSVRLTGPTASYELTRAPETNRVYYEAKLQVSEPVDYYDQLPPSAWTPGKWTLTAPGDDTVHPVRIETDIPGPVRFENPQSLRTIDRSRDLTLRWSTTGLQGADILNVTFLPARLDLPAVFCSARALDGTLTVPASLLSTLPPGQPMPDRSPLLHLGLSRMTAFEQLRIRNADQVPAIVEWRSSELLLVTLR